MSNLQSCAQVHSIAPDTLQNVFDTALKFHELGYSPIWLMGKKPFVNGWNQLPNHSSESLRTSFKPGYNLGVRCGQWSSPKPGTGLVVVDVDVADTQYIDAAYAKLDELTGGVHGRGVVTGSRKGGHHYWYGCPIDRLPLSARTVIAKSGETVSVTTKGVSKQKQTWAIEVLSTGAQAVTPPSIHPITGQAYEWENERMPLDDLPAIPERLLDLLHDSTKPTRQETQDNPTERHPLESCLFIQHCQKEAASLPEPLWYAAACNLAVTDGGREFFHMISGPHPDYTPADADKKFDHAAKGDKPHTCRAIAEQGFKCPVMQQDGRCHIHGGKAPAVFATADQVQSVVTELNQKHAVIHARNTLVLSETDEPCMRRKIYETESLESFRNWYLNRKIEDKSVAALWLKHPDRRQYDGMVFAPGEEHPGFFNLFRGFPVGPKPGDASYYWEFVKTVICGGNDTYYTYVRKWLAHLFQKPNVLPETAIVLRGKQGTGKNTFVGAAGRLVGQHFLELVNMNQLAGRFNSHLKDALLVHANEAVWGGDKQSVGAIKAMITDPITAVEQKGRDIIQLRNYKRLVVSSNENWTVPRDMDDRRFFVLDVSDVHKEDKPYFAKIHQGLEGNGLAALMHDLLAEDLTDFETRSIPQNNNGLDLKILSSDSVTQWYFQVLIEGKLGCYDPSQVGSATPDWPAYVPKTALHARYLAWCSDQKMPRPFIMSEFGKQLMKLIPGLSVSQLTIANSRTRVYDLPTIDNCRKGFEKAAKLEKYNWDAVT